MKRPVTISRRSLNPPKYTVRNSPSRTGVLRHGRSKAPHPVRIENEVRSVTAEQVVDTGNVDQLATVVGEVDLDTSVAA
jgi:hypothetical protein